MLIECPHCHKRVIPKANNICPSCREDMSDMVGVDPNQIALTLHESEALPPYCYLCNMYTERRIRVSGDQEPDLGAMFFVSNRPQDTSNVIISLPQCEVCSELNEPEVVEVDYEHQTMTIMVHKGFRHRVYEIKGIKPGAESETDDSAPEE